MVDQTATKSEVGNSMLTWYNESTNKMIILFTKFPLESHFGGGEKHTIQLAQELTNHGHLVLLLSSDTVLLKQWKKAGWRLF